MDVSIKTKKITVTPTVDTNAYAANDRLGTIQTLSAAVGHKDRGVTLQNVLVLDKSKLEKPMTIFFFEELPTVASADNAALDITDAEMEKCIGHVVVGASDYQPVANASIACVKPSSACVGLRSAEDSGNLYAVVKINDSATYGAASDLRFTYIVQQDS